MPACAMRYEGRPEIAVPPNEIRPALQGSMPMIERTVVVLPMPFLPSRVATCPCAMRMETPNSTWLCP